MERQLRQLREFHQRFGADGQPVLRADGKVLKAELYSPPDMRAIVGADK